MITKTDKEIKMKRYKQRSSGILLREWHHSYTETNMIILILQNYVTQVEHVIRRHRVNVIRREANTLRKKSRVTARSPGELRPALL